MVIKIPVENHVADFLKTVSGEVISFKKRITDPNITMLYILLDRPAKYREKESIEIVKNYKACISIQICDKWVYEYKWTLSPGDNVRFNNLVSLDIYHKLKEQLIGAGEGYNFAAEYRKFIDRYQINDAHFPYERAKKYFQRHKELIIR